MSGLERKPSSLGSDLIRAGSAMGRQISGFVSPEMRRAALNIASNAEMAVLSRVPQDLQKSAVSTFMDLAPSEAKSAVLNAHEALDDHRFNVVMERLMKIPKEYLPKHILLIPDGNRRYAREHGLPDSEGHALGAKKLFGLLEMFRTLDIPEVTAWVWSEQNFKNRSDQERDEVFGIAEQYIYKALPHLIESEGKFEHVGRTDRLPQNLLDSIDHAKTETESFEKHTLRLAIDYGDVYEDSRFAKGKSELLTPDEVVLFDNTTDQEWKESWVEEIWDKYHSMSDVDLVMRTGIEPDEFPYLANFGHAVRNSRVAPIVTELPATPAYVIALQIEKYARMKMKGKIREGR